MLTNSEIERLRPYPVRDSSIQELILEILSYGVLSKSDLAEILGVTRATIYNWLNGDDPSPDRRRRLCVVRDNLIAQKDLGTLPRLCRLSRMQRKSEIFDLFV